MNKTILVIEDNSDNMTIVCWILEDAGYKVQKAVCATDGLALLHSELIDLVLMDVSLPDMSGLEATRLIKTDSTLETIPVIGLSAYAMESDKQAALAAGCEDYLTKPIFEDVLLGSISKILK